MSFRTRLILFALTYGAGAELSYLLLSKTGDVVAFWPPVGMCLAMLLATPRRRWWAVLLAAGVPNLLSDAVVHHHSLPASFGFLLVNLGAPLVGAALITRLCRPAFTFARLSHVLAWSAVTSLVSTPLGALFGAAVNQAFYGGAFGRKILFWWIGDLLGVLLLTPLTYGVLHWRKWPRPAEALEMTALLLSLSATTIWVFRQPNTFALPPAALFFFLLWAALRFGATAVAAATSVLAVIALWLTALGFGPYSFQLTMSARLLMTQMMVVTGALLFYILAAVMAERRAAESELQTSNLRLDQQVQARTTELTTANQQLRISAERLQLGVEVAEFALCEIDYTNNTNHLSKEAARLYGLGKEEMTVPREVLHATFHPDDAAQLATLIAESLNPDGDGGFAREHRVVWKNGDVRWLSVRKQIFFDRTSNPPRPVRGIMAAHDITERKQAEEILRENQCFTNSIIETAPTVLYTFDLKTKTNTYLTGQAAQVLGYSFDELKEANSSFLAGFMHPDDAKAAEKHFKKISQTQNGEVFEFEYRMRHKSGEWRWFRSRDKVFKRDENGKPSEILGIASDITERKRAEEQLKLAAERNEIAQEAARASLYEYIPQTDQVIRNESFASVLGYAADEIPSTSEAWTKLIHPDDLPESLEIFGKGIESSEGFTHEYRVRHKDGHYIWLYDRARALRDEQGNIERVVGMIVDITTRKQAEAVLADRTELLTGVLEGTTDVIFVKDLNSRLLLANAAFAAAAGSTPEQLVGKTDEDWFPPDVAAAVRQHDEVVIAGGSPIQLEETVPVAGELRVFLTLKAPLRDGGGRVVGILGISRDITERKRAETSLRISEERFRRLFEAAQDGILILNPDTAQIIDANPYIAELLGFSHAELLGKELWEIGLYEDIEKSKADMQELQEKKYIRYEDLPLETKTGRRVNVEFVSNLYAEGDETVIQCNIRDITERKQAEAERERLLAQEQQARETAEAATRTKDEFLALVTHELRNPLNAILGYTRMNRRNPHDAAQVARNSEIVERSARMQQQLIDDLLDTARIVSGKLKIEAAPIDLRLILEDALSVVRPAAEARQIELTARFTDDPQEVIGDAARLQQVALNLLQNAIKFTPESGRVELRVERADHHHRLIVSDTGKGIEPDFLPYIFDRFSQTDTSNTRRHGGLGLGLALVKQLVELHGGTIAATSAGREMGSTFTVTLPLRPPQLASSLQNARAITEMNDEAHRRELAPLPRLTGVRVLVVDDQEEARMLVAAMLEERGAQVTTTASGTEAVTLVEQTPFDVLVCDISMPEVDGYEVMRRIRAHEIQRGLNLAQGLPAVALTALSRSEDRLRALSAGFQIHTAKPVEPAELIVVIASLIGSR